MRLVERPTLLILASTYPRWEGDHEPGFVHELSKRLTRRFHVIVLCPHAAGALSRETLDGVEVVRYRYAPERWETLVNDGGIVANLRRSRWKCLLVPGFVLAQAWGAWRLLRKKKVDVVHAHWLIPQGVIAVFLHSISRKKIPFLVTSHGADLHALKGRVLDYLKCYVANHAMAVTVVSGAMREKLQTLSVNPEKISVLSMGVDMQDRFREDAAVPRGRREILFVGRLVEKKGGRYLLNAMPRVLQRFPDAFLTIAGFGPEEEALKAQVDALELRQSVNFLGAMSQTELPALYRRAALFVAPFVRAKSGDEEGLGLVLIEAISCGCPILAGNVPALAEVLGEEFDDMAVNPLDTSALAERMMELLENPGSARARVTHLRKAISKRFDWDEVAERYSDLLSRIVWRGCNES